MTVLVADASSLILLAKTGVLFRLVEHAVVLVPRAVYAEVCGAEHMHLFADAELVAALTKRGKLHVREVRELSPVPLALGRGEHEAVSLFLQERADAVLTDDGRAIRTCRLLGIPYLTSPGAVVELFLRGDLTAAEARLALEKLSVFGRYAPDVIAAALLSLTPGGRREK